MKLYKFFTKKYINENLSIIELIEFKKTSKSLYFEINKLEFIKVFSFIKYIKSKSNNLFIFTYLLVSYLLRIKRISIFESKSDYFIIRSSLSVSYIDKSIHIKKAILGRRTINHVINEYKYLNKIKNTSLRNNLNIPLGFNLKENYISYRYLNKYVQLSFVSKKIFVNRIFSKYINYLITNSEAITLNYYLKKFDLKIKKFNKNELQKKVLISNCHNDLASANILVRGNRFIIIDWELHNKNCVLYDFIKLLDYPDLSITLSNFYNSYMYKKYKNNFVLYKDLIKIIQNNYFEISKKIKS